MGRTIHYGFSLKDILPIAKQKKICDITDEYNTKYTWTCENVGFSNFGFYPNWDFFRKTLTNTVGKDTDSIWNFVNREYARLEKKGFHHLDCIAALKQKGFVNSFKDSPTEFRGFTKVAGNEWNSLLVIAYLVEISKVVPTVEIEVHDEGEFLLLPIKIKNGKAKIDFVHLKSQLCYWQATDYNTHLVIPTLDKVQERGVYFGFTMKSFMQRRCVRNWGGVKEYKKELAFRMIHTKVSGNTFRPVGDFCRKVRREDFSNHPQFKTMVIETGKKMPAFTNVMAGFYGEYWNKNHERVELQSEQHGKLIYNLLSGFAGKDAED